MRAQTNLSRAQYCYSNCLLVRLNVTVAVRYCAQKAKYTVEIIHCHGSGITHSSSLTTKHRYEILTASSVTGTQNTGAGP